MTNKANLIVIFTTGCVAGTVFAATAVSWKWNRDFDDWSAMGLADQANVAREIHAGRSEELAARILNALPGYVVDMNRNFRDTNSTATALRLVGAAYRESGEPMPDEVREILKRRSIPSN
jgi:hypothetical protein